MSPDSAILEIGKIEGFWLPANARRDIDNRKLRGINEYVEIYIQDGSQVVDITTPLDDENSRSVMELIKILPTQDETQYLFFVDYFENRGQPSRNEMDGLPFRLTFDENGKVSSFVSMDKEGYFGSKGTLYRLPMPLWKYILKKTLEGNYVDSKGNHYAFKSDSLFELPTSSESIAVIPSNLDGYGMYEVGAGFAKKRFYYKWVDGCLIIYPTITQSYKDAEDAIVPAKTPLYRLLPNK
jgi:hypothetical protein